MIIEEFYEKDSKNRNRKYATIKCDKCTSVYKSRVDQCQRNFARYGENKCKKCVNEAVAFSRKGIKRATEVIAKGAKKRAETIRMKYPKLTLTCKCCNKEFTVPYGQRNRLYCGRSCQAKSVKHTDIRSISKCLICKKEFKHYGERILCSRECTAKYLAISRIGENNPAFKRNKEKNKCLYCKKEFEYSRCGLHCNQVRVFCSLACAHRIDLRGVPLTCLGKRYPSEFNAKLKTTIRDRDNHECQLCGAVEVDKTHHVHHIDYNKSNLDHDNLITLCEKCHNITHHGRTFWQIIFGGLISGSTIVKKPWGAEIHIVNHNNYCLKYLIFFKSRQFSYHTHKLKRELWHCLYGKLECILGSNYFIMKQGDKIEITPNTVHQLQAIKNSILVEVSTRDYVEDSIRIKNSTN